MRVLGIDPGTLITGWGVVEERDSRLVRVASGVMRARGPLANRLADIFDKLEEVLTRFRPTVLSVEKSFVAANVQSAFRLGEARGVVLAAGARAGVIIREYSPAEIKLSIAGTGRANKAQVQEMVRRLLGLRVQMVPDEADALATAICHLHLRGIAERVALQETTGARRRGRGRRAWTHLAGAAK